MPRLKSVTDANGTKIYPITITRGVYDTDKNQRLNETLANKAENTVMGASGSNHAKGLVPDPGATAGTSKYLREDGTWQTPTDTKVTLTAVTTNADYEVLFSTTADNTTRTEAAKKASNLKFNPSTGNLQATKLNGVTIGSNPKFDATKVEASETNGNIKIDGTETTVYTLPATDPYTSARTPSSHTHGNITNAGTITSTAVTSATGVLVYDSNNKIQRATAAQTRSIIGAGTSSFSGSYTDLTNKPTIPAAANNGTFSVKTKVGTNDAVTAADFTANQSSADDVTFIQGTNVTLTTDTTNRTVTVAAKDTTYTFDGTYNASTNKAATVSTVTKAINALDGGTIGTPSAGKTITALSQTNGNISATFGNISITKSLISDFPTIPTVNNAKFSVKGAGTEVASTTANASSASSVDIVADGNNVTVTPDATNNQIKIAATNTTYKLTIGSTTNGDSANGVNLGTLESKAAASSGTDLSLVTTGEKNTWNSKQNALTNPVTRSGSTALTANKIVLGNGSNTVIPSSYGITATAPSSTSDDTTIPTSKAVWSAVANGIAANDAMVYKGTIAGGSTGSYGALTSAASKGETYKVTAAGKIDGIAVEVGDMLICNTDSTAAATSSNYSTIAANWDFILANIDGAVTGPASSTDGNLASFSGATGKVVKDSSLTTTNVSDAVTKKHSHSSLTLSTTAQAYDGTHTLALPSSDPYSSARTPASHTHGNIQNGGTLLTNDVTIANGDKLVVTDSSNSNKVARTSVAFDGSTTTKALTLKGTFESFATSNTTYKFTIGTTTKGDSTNGVDLGTLKSETAAASGTTLSLVTTGEKATWNAKQSALTFTSTPSSTNKVVTLNDVPSSLPANGGNADTVDGLHIVVVTSMPSSPDANTIYIVK